MDSREQSNEIWWLIEKINQQSDGKQFWSGSEWVTSALKAARFPSQEAAQNVLDNFIESISAFGTPYLLRAFAKPVEHMWMTTPQSKPQMRVSELIKELREEAQTYISTDTAAGRSQGVIISRIADRLASLDLQPDPPTECELTKKEILALRASRGFEAKSVKDIDKLDTAIGKEAAKKAFAAGKNEVLKDPERFGLERKK